MASYIWDLVRTWSQLFAERQNRRGRYQVRTRSELFGRAPDSGTSIRVRPCGRRPRLGCTRRAPPNAGTWFEPGPRSRLGLAVLRCEGPVRDGPPILVAVVAELVAERE